MGEYSEYSVLRVFVSDTLKMRPDSTTFETDACRRAEFSAHVMEPSPHSLRSSLKCLLTLFRDPEVQGTTFVDARHLGLARQ